MSLSKLPVLTICSLLALPLAAAPDDARLVPALQNKIDELSQSLINGLGRYQELSERYNLLQKRLQATLQTKPDEILVALRTQLNAAQKELLERKRQYDKLFADWQKLQSEYSDLNKLRTVLEQSRNTAQKLVDSTNERCRELESALKKSTLACERLTQTVNAQKRELESDRADRKQTATLWEQIRRNVKAESIYQQLSASAELWQTERRELQAQLNKLKTQISELLRSGAELKAVNRQQILEIKKLTDAALSGNTDANNLRYELNLLKVDYTRLQSAFDRSEADNEELRQILHRLVKQYQVLPANYAKAVQSVKKADVPETKPMPDAPSVAEYQQKLTRQAQTIADLQQKLSEQNQLILQSGMVQTSDKLIRFLQSSLSDAEQSQDYEMAAFYSGELRKIYPRRWDYQLKPVVYYLLTGQTTPAQIELQNLATDGKDMAALLQIWVLLAQRQFAAAQAQLNALPDAAGLNADAKIWLQSINTQLRQKLNVSAKPILDALAQYLQ